MTSLAVGPDSATHGGFPDAILGGGSHTFSWDFVSHKNEG